MLLSLGIIHAPVKIMYSESGVVTALIQSTLPFMIVSIRNVLFMVDHFTEEAASTLGAHPYQVFFRITLPLSFPGIAAGTLLVFVTSMSAFVTPELIGGGQVPTLASIVLRETQMNLNWSLSSTISVIILIMTLIVVFSYNRLLESKWLGGGGKS
jgi:putative spermidine/putrescine transport system permease protein